MASNENAPAEPAKSSRAVNRSRWLNPRRKRFWLLVAVLVYSLLGFFATPVFIKNSVISLLRDDLGRSAKIENIKVNPYTLSLRVQGFEVSDTDGVRLAAFEELFVNFQFASILKWAWTFSQVQLTSPYLHFERLPSGDTRLHRLLADFENSRPPGATGNGDTEAANGTPRILIRNLELVGGQVDATDNMPETPVDLQMSSINIAIKELNTIPDHYGQQTVAISLPDDARLTWSGSLNLAPLNSRGRLELEGLRLAPVIAYLKTALPLESLNAELSSRFQYHLRTDDEGEFKLDIDQWEVTLDEVLANGLTPAADFIDIPHIALLDGKLRFPEKSLFFSELEIQNPRLTAWVNEDASISVMELIPQANEMTVPSDSDSKTLPWRLGIGQAVLENASLALTDRSIRPNAAINLTQLNASIAGISNGKDISIPIELSGKLATGGTYSAAGNMVILPQFSITADMVTEAIPLSLGQAYVQQFAHVSIENGVLNSDLQLSYAGEQNFELGGSLAIPDLEITDTLKNEKLLAWEQLETDRFDVSAKGLHISQLQFAKPYMRFVINEDMTTNLAGLVIEQPVPETNGKDDGPMDITIGGISIEDGAMDFADFSLPLTFATNIGRLDGTISTIATRTVEPANVRLEGQVEEYGLARINGTINVLQPIKHTDMTVEFRNLLMPKLSPYTVAFAGQQIEQGKLDLGLVYFIENGRLKGENDIVLSDLKLGEKVEHPDAANLPLGLAVSLLKDSNGVIKVDLPVEGDLNDPEFKIGGVIWQAFTGLVTKIVSAPFKLLGNLIGIDSEDFGQIEFLAGRSDLTPPELEKISQIEQALLQRPQLTVEIGGVTDRVIDIPALKFIHLRQLASERLDEALDDQHGDTMMLDDEIRGVVEILFAERFPDVSRQDIRAEHTAPPADDPEGKPLVDELAYATDLWNRLLASEIISDQDLADLATARARAIKAGFLANGLIGEGRIAVVESNEVDSDDEQWVKLELAVASD
jgi:hypothetical protein